MKLLHTRAVKMTTEIVQIGKANGSLIEAQTLAINLICMKQMNEGNFSFIPSKTELQSEDDEYYFISIEYID